MGAPRWSFAGHAAQQTLANATLLVRRVRHFSKRIMGLLAPGENVGEVQRLAIAHNLEAHRVSGPNIADPGAAGSGRLPSIPLHNQVSGTQAGSFRGAAWIDIANENALSARVAQCEAQIDCLHVVELQFQAGSSQEPGERNLIDSGHIAMKEIFEARACNLLDRCTNPVAVVVKLASLRVFLVHAAHDIVQRLAIVCRVANYEVEKHSENLPFVVVRNAAVRKSVLVVFFEPGVETRLLGALRLAGGP